MKKLVLVLFLSVIVIPLSAQRLIDVYKQGTVRLVPDTEYARDNDWNKVFETYYDTLYGEPMGDRKSLVIMPDGSAVVNHSYKNYYTKFSSDGKFEKEFGIINSKGERFEKAHGIAGIIDNNVFFTSPDNMGNMVCFDFTGLYVKTLNLDYMVKQMISLPGNKIAVVGWVIWSTKFRDFVAIVDYETNDQKIIWDHFTNRQEPPDERELFHYYYRLSEDFLISFNTMPYSSLIVGMRPPPRIAYTNNRLVIAIPLTGAIQVYDLEGNLISEDKTEWVSNYLPVDEQKEIQKEAIDRIKNEFMTASERSGITPEEMNLARETIIREMEADLDKISEPLPLPAFSTTIQDSDGNILFFEFPREENANKFNVWIYEDTGRYVCQSSFVCDEYNLEISPSKMVFHNGYIYGLQHLKTATGVPLRLVRFKLTSN